MGENSPAWSEATSTVATSPIKSATAPCRNHSQRGLDSSPRLRRPIRQATTPAIPSKVVSYFQCSPTSPTSGIADFGEVGLQIRTLPVEARRLLAMPTGEARSVWKQFFETQRARRSLRELCVCSLCELCVSKIQWLIRRTGEVCVSLEKRSKSRSRLVGSGMPN